MNQSFPKKFLSAAKKSAKAEPLKWLSIKENAPTEKRLHKMYGCENCAAPAVLLSEKTSGEPISAAIPCMAINAITKSITEANHSVKKTVLIRRAIVTFV